MINREDVRHVADLARLELTDAEVDSFTRQLDSVLEYVELLNKLDTESVEPTSFLSPEHDPLRSDTVGASLPREKTLMNGPDVTKGSFAVPKIIH